MADWSQIGAGLGAGMSKDLGPQYALAGAHTNRGGGGFFGGGGLLGGLSGSLGGGFGLPGFGGLPGPGDLLGGATGVLGQAGGSLAGLGDPYRQLLGFNPFDPLGLFSGQNGGGGGGNAIGQTTNSRQPAPDTSGMFDESLLRYRRPELHAIPPRPPAGPPVLHAIPAPKVGPTVTGWGTGWGAGNWRTGPAQASPLTSMAPTVGPVQSAFAHVGGTHAAPAGGGTWSTAQPQATPRPSPLGGGTWASWGGR